MTLDQNTLLLGKLLAEIYRLQKNANVPTVDDACIYGLKNGFESAIRDEVERIGSISGQQLKHVMNVLEPIWQNKAKLAAFKGFYDIERELADGGVDRTDAIHILTYLSQTGQFAEVIAKMDSSNSPGECRTFKLDEWDV